MNKKICAAFLLLTLTFGTVGCGNDEPPAKEEKATVMPDLNTLNDGVYTAKSSTHTLLGHSEITLTIKDHRITDVQFAGYTIDGRLKEADYGDDKDSTLQKKAKIAVKAMQSYAEQLKEKQSLDEVDAVTGATVSYEQFMESAQIALKSASPADCCSGKPTEEAH